MITKSRLALAALPLLFVSSPALAVSDPPVHLDQRKATEFYQSARFLLGTDLGYCGDNEVARSGLITGGGLPGSGSQTIVIDFSKGAKLKVVRMYHNAPDKRSVDVQISCS